jgi:gas vesicle protein
VKGNFNGGLELHVSVPRGLAVKMEVGVGTAKTNGDYRSVDFSIGAGDFVGRFDLTGRGSSEVHVGAGRVELNIPRGANLDVNTATGVGDVTGLPATQEDTKGLHIGDRRAARFGNGGASLSVHVGAGAIVINSSSNPKALPSESADTDIDQGAREQSLWSGDVDSNMSMDLDPDKTLAVIGPTVDRAIALSNAEVDQAMKQCKPEMDQDLANVGPEVARALKEVQPEIDRALAEVGPDVDRALKQNRPEIDRELAKIGPEIAKAMKEMRPQIEQARKEQMRELQKMRPEIEQAMKEAEKAIDEAARELGKEGGDHSTLEKSVRKAILDALKSAREAMKEAKSAAQKAVQDAKKHSADDEDN